MNTNKKLNVVIVALILIIIVVGTFAIKRTLGQDPTTKVSETPNMQTMEPSPSPTPKVMLPELVEYYNKNKHTIGWIKIDGTPIDYPVMFTPGDNEFYLQKDFDGKYSAAGTLYIDSESQISTPNANIIIYGHNMKNDTMFGSLSNYKDKSYYDQHPTITFNTLYEKGTYEIVAAFYAKVLMKSDKTSFRYYQYRYASTEEEYNTFINYLKSVRQYDTGVETKYGDQFITLSTCSYHVENGRFAVVARRVEENATTTQNTQDVQPNP